MQVARRSAWLLPVALMAAIVILQLIRPACGSDRRGQNYRSSGGRSTRYQDEVEEEETEGEHDRDFRMEPLTSRFKRTRSSVSRRRNTALMSLTLVGVAAAFMTAGYLAQHYYMLRKAARPGSPESKVAPEKAPGAPPEAAPATAVEKEAVAGVVAAAAKDKALLEQQGSKYLSVGKKYVAPAAAVGLAAAAVGWVQKFGSPLGYRVANNSTAP